MHCNICDKTLSEKEISWNTELGRYCTGDYEPCSNCLEVALEAAYTDGFKSEEDEIEEEIGDEYGDGVVETFDLYTHTSIFESDPYVSPFEEGYD